MRYRINRLKEIFGDIIDDPDRRLAFELTLRVMRLQQKRDGAAGTPVPGTAMLR